MRPNSFSDSRHRKLVDHVEEHLCRGDEAAIQAETYRLTAAFLCLPAELRRSEIERMETLALEMVS